MGQQFLHQCVNGIFEVEVELVLTTSYTVREFSPEVPHLKGQKENLRTCEMTNKYSCFTITFILFFFIKYRQIFPIWALNSHFN